MPEVLIDGGKAAALYIASLGFARVQQYRNVDQVCLNSSYHDQSRIICLGWDGSEPSNSFIGVDGADVGYFHLTNIKTSWQEAANGAACDGTTGNYYFTGYSLAGVTVNVYDGGSDTAPWDGHTIIQHSGYPVCAARRRAPGTSNWVPFSAGDASALTVAAARAACGVNDFYGDLGGAPEPIKIIIRSV